MRLSVGDQIALVGQAADGSTANDLYWVAGLLDSPIELLHKSGVIMTLADAQRFLVMPDAAHQVTVMGLQPERARELAARIEASLGPSAGAVAVRPWQELEPVLVNLLETSECANLVVLLLVLLASAAGVANTMLTGTFERTREIGMLHALGCKPCRTIRLITTEALLLGLLGVTIGTALGLVLVAATSATGLHIGLPGASDAGPVAFFGVVPQAIHPRLEITDPIIGAGAAALTAVLAALAPAIYAARLQPVVAMRS
jgi:ABC-type lipoprotein release transport system permease subunit